MSATREHVGTHHQHSIAGLTRLYSLNVLFSFFFFGSTRGDAEKKFGGARDRKAVGSTETLPCQL